MGMNYDDDSAWSPPPKGGSDTDDVPGRGRSPLCGNGGGIGVDRVIPQQQQQQQQQSQSSSMSIERLVELRRIEEGAWVKPS